MDRFVLMRTLIAAAQAGSFNAAAREIGASKSHVSRQVGELERELGVKLVERGPGAFALTDTGRRYLKFSEHVIGALEAEHLAVRELNARPEGGLSVIAPRWIGSLDLADAVAAFALKNPLISVRFDTGPGDLADRTYSFVEDGYDVAFYARPLRDSSMKCRRVAALRFGLCASPSYLREHGTPADGKDLNSHACVTHRNDPVWRLLEDGRQLNVKISHPAFSTNTYLVAMEAALQRVGIALLPISPLRKEIAAGELVVLSNLVVPSRPLFAIYPPGLQSVRRLRVFVEFVAAWFGDPPDAALPCAKGSEPAGNIAVHEG